MKGKVIYINVEFCCMCYFFYSGCLGVWNPHLNRTLDVLIILDYCLSTNNCARPEVLILALRKVSIAK